MLPQPPCKQNGKLCSNHSIGCKSSCKAYHEWEKLYRIQKDEILANQRKNNMVNNDVRYRHSKMTGKKLNAR